MNIQGETPQVRLTVEDESGIGEARRLAQRLAQAQKFGTTAAGKVAIAASELATNLLRHAGGGELLMQLVESGDLRMVELLSVDKGRGMENVERCLVDGYSTNGTPGNGLGAVRRMSVEFDLHSAAGEGTILMARIASSERAKPPKDGFRFGAVSVPKPGEHECGDAWRLVQHQGALSMIVADGLGHGSLAAVASRAAADAYREDPFEPPAVLLERAHRSMTATRGAAVACARLGTEGGIAYAGIGNIAGTVLKGERSTGMVSHNGTLGHGLRRVQQFEYRREAGDVTVMHSDGLSARWSLGTVPGLLQRHPAVIAGLLYRDQWRQRDDVTVVVVA